MDSGAEEYKRYLDGDDDGIVKLIATYKDGLLFYLNGFTHSLEDAEELTEDTFVKLAIEKPRYNGKAAFKTWLYTIARNLTIDRLRKEQAWRWVPLGNAEDVIDREDAAAVLLRTERDRRVHAAMKTLTPEQQQVLWLVYFEDFSSAEIGMILGKKAAAVDSLAYRARKALKEELERSGFTYENS